MKDLIPIIRNIISILYINHLIDKELNNSLISKLDEIDIHYDEIIKELSNIQKDIK